MLITTKENIKELLGKRTSEDDVVLASIATAVSAHMERNLFREIEKKERTEYFDVDQGQRIFLLTGFPVTQCAVYSDVAREFGSGTVVDPKYYTFLGSWGELVIDNYGIAIGPKMLKVVYTGGMAENQKAFQEAYPDIEMAARIQGAFWFQKKDRLGISVEAVHGQGNIQYQKLELLPTVKEALIPYRRALYV